MKRFIRLQSLVLAFVFLSAAAFAQKKDWLVRMQDPNVNFWELQKDFNDYWKDRTDYKSNGYKVFKRWEYINEVRVGPDGKLPASDYVQKEYERYMKTAPVLKSASGTWQIVGPTAYPTNNTGQPTGKGRVNAIAFHPSDSNTVYLGTPSGGIWKSINGGVNWTNLSANIPYLGVSAILIHPSNPNIIYIGTGDRDSEDAPGLGVYKSTDGGATWVPMNFGMGNTTVGMMVMHPSDPNTLIAATYDGLFKTTNGGVTWTKTRSGDFRDVKFKPGDPTVMYATRIITPAEFYRSTDGGSSWTKITTIPTSGVGSRMVIGVSPANSDYVYLVQINSTDNTFKAMLRSADSGQTFTQRSSTPNIFDYACDGSGTASQATYDLVIDVDQANAETVYVGSVNSWKSTNGGVNWTPVTHWVGSGFAPADPTANCAASVHADHHWYQWSPLHNPKRLYLGCDGGIYYTANGGTTWTEISNDLPTGQVYKIGQSAQSAGTVAAGFQDNGVSATNNGVSFTTVAGGDGCECAVDYSNPNFCYRETQSGGLRRSSTGVLGSSSNIISTLSDQAAFVAPYMLHRTIPSTMFFGRTNLWRSTNVTSIPASSVVWDAISTFPAGATIRVVEQSPADLNVVYIFRGSGESSALYRTDNANAAAASVTWTTITKPAGLVVTDIKAHPSDPNIVYATAGMQVFKSTDKGATWTDITGNLPALFVNCLVLDKNGNEAIYIGNQTGVWYKDATLTEWILFSSGLPPVEVRELEIYYDANPDNSRLTAATYGRGVWQSDLVQVNVINPSNLVATPVNASQIDLSWALNGAGNNVLIATSPTTTFGVPADGTAYTAGNTLPGGGTVVYVGNLTNFSHTGLSSNTNYCYKIWAVNNSSQYSSGLPPVCATTLLDWTGNVNTDWFNTGNWGSGAVPTPVDAAYIPAGRPNYPVINAAGATCYHLTIASGASLGMDALTAYTLQVAGDWENNGTFNAGVGTVEFNGSNTLQTIKGTSTSNFYILQVTKGSASNILDAVSPISLTATVDAPLTLNSGTFRLSNAASNITAIRANGTTVPANAIGSNKRFWVSAGTLNVNSSWRINAGELRITGGTVNVGNANNQLLDYLNNGTLIVQGGQLNVSAGIWGNALDRSSTGTMDISGGTIILGKFLNGFSRAMLEVNANCAFTMSGGTIVIQSSNGYTEQYTNLSTTSSVTGGTLQIGNASTPASQTIRINSTTPVYNLLINATNAPTVQLVTNNLTVKNDLTISGGTLNANSLNLTVGGHWSNSGTFTPGTGTVTFNGTANQNLGGTVGTKFNNLTLNNASGLTLNSSVNDTINGTLTLTSGVITTGSNKVVVSSTGSVARTSGHIFGNLQKNVAIGSGVSRSFEIGDASAANYTPVTLTFASVTTPGNLTARAVSGDHPQIGSSTLNASRSVNRYWSLTNSATVFTTYDGVFTFPSSDLDPSANTSALVGGKYDAPNWTYPAVGAKTATSTELTGMSSFSDFQLAEAGCINPSVPTLTASVNPDCSGQPTNLSIASGNLNGAASWQWYSGSCGGTPVGSGTSVTVSPTTTTTYYARGEGGCLASPGACGSITITVNNLPAVTCPSNSSVCISAPAFALTGGSPAGGTYSGSGVSAGMFDPATAGLGAKTITYSYTDGNGCTNSCTCTITVNALPAVTCPSNSSVCINAPAFALTGGSPSGGTYSGPGVSAGMFDPATAGLGAKTITYSYTDGNGCANSCTYTITVNNLPTVTCPSNSSVCINAPAFALTGGSPAGGTYSGPGVSAGMFNPATAGAGAKTITYSYTDGNGCTNSCTYTITVNNLPTVTCPSNSSVCINAAAFALTGGSPAGGTYSGPGVSAGMFNPAAAGAGAKTITYSYTDGNGCTNSCTYTITVNALPVVTCPSNSSVCISTPAFALTGGSPAGGTYSGPGVSAGMFNPATAGTGTHTITYTYTNGNNCTNSCTYTIAVNPCTGNTISGTILWEQDGSSGVNQTTVKLTGDQTNTTTTGTNGVYSLTATSGSNFTVTPSKNINKLNGVTVLDVTAIQQHVANITLLPAPFKRIAADVNKSNSINSLDATLLNQALLGSTTALNQITSWRFVPSAYTFANPNLPWGFPEQISLSGVSGNVSGQDFKGIKTGDVVAAFANPANFGAGEPLVLRVQDAQLQAGDPVSVEFRADQLTDLTAFQLALLFDPEQLQLTKIEPLDGFPLTLENFGTFQITDGEIRLVWAQTAGIPMFESTPLFRLQFSALKSGRRLSEVLQLNDAALPGLAYNSAYEESGVELRYTQSTGVQQPAEPVALLVRPNPFNTSTTLSFRLPAATEAELRVTDVVGRVLYTHRETYAAGQHDEILRLDGVHGVLYAELVTEWGRVVRKIVAAD